MEQTASKERAALEEIKQRKDLMLMPKDIAPVLGVDPQSIRMQAREAPEKLGFRVTVIGGRSYFPRLPFIEWIEGRSSAWRDS